MWRLLLDEAVGPSVAARRRLATTARRAAAPRPSGRAEARRPEEAEQQRPGARQPREDRGPEPDQIHTDRGAGATARPPDDHTAERHSHPPAPRAHPRGAARPAAG